MKFPFGFAGLFILGLWLSSPSIGADLDSCKNSGDNYIQIDKCTDFINEAQHIDDLSGLPLSTLFDLQAAYEVRGSAHIGLGLDNKGRVKSRSHLRSAWSDFTSALSMAEEFRRRDDIQLARENKSYMLVRRAQVSEWLVDFGAALRDYNEALLLTPNSVRALSGRGYAYIRIDRPDRAKKDFQRVLRLDPTDLPSVHGLKEAESKLRKK